MRATAALPLPLLPIFLLALSLGAQAFEVRRVAVGLDRPVFLTTPPGDRDRVFIVEQHSGDIRILRLATGSLEATPFLTVGGVATGNEQGLLGLAFHPDYASNGFFYVYYTNPATQVRRYQVSADPDVA
ncbi:MAG: PQQ-dependent sugar dehydrogenase, partial [Myxococcales bacterium]|nr:PQQ-dependent sugar dehydrogenase [Myxococcales bacterium]